MVLYLGHLVALDICTYPFLSFLCTSLTNRVKNIIVGCLDCALRILRHVPDCLWEHIGL